MDQWLLTDRRFFGDHSLPAGLKFCTQKGCKTRSRCCLQLGLEGGVVVKGRVHGSRKFNVGLAYTISLVVEADFKLFHRLWAVQAM